MSRAKTPSGSFWCSVAATWLVLLSGCGQNEFGMRVDIPAKDRAPITQAVRESMTLSLPAQPFNVHSRRSAQTPGATGQARGDSDAQPQGQAFCQASAGNGGAAWAEFQLGHALRNTAGATVRMTVKLDLDYTHHAQASPPEASNTLAELTLKVYLKDAQGKLLHHQVLAELSSDEAQSKWSGRHQIEFDAVLEPAMSYDLVITGRASVLSELDTKAEARIEVKRFTAELLCGLAGEGGG